jgi:hypothetical protein
MSVIKLKRRNSMKIFLISLLAILGSLSPAQGSRSLELDDVVKVGVVATGILAGRAAWALKYEEPLPKSVLPTEHLFTYKPRQSHIKSYGAIAAGAATYWIHQTTQALKSNRSIDAWIWGIGSGLLTLASVFYTYEGEQEPESIE